MCDAKRTLMAATRLNDAPQPTMSSPQHTACFSEGVTLERGDYTLRLLRFFSNSPRLPFYDFLFSLFFFFLALAFFSNSCLFAPAFGCSLCRGFLFRFSSCCHFTFLFAFYCFLVLLIANFIDVFVFDISMRDSGVRQP